MTYISPQNEYPRHPGDIQIASPEWETGMPLPSGWIEVTPVTPPTPSSSQVLEELFPIQENGVWRQNWQLRDLTEEELATRNAPITARQKLKDLAGLTDVEIDALSRGLV